MRITKSCLNALLGAAVRESFQTELDGIDLAAIAHHSFSQEHQKRIKSILRRHYSKLIRVKVLHWAKRIAVVILILVSLIFAGMMSVKAIRDQLTHIVTQWYSKYIDIDFTRDEQAGGTSDSDVIDLQNTGMALPSYIPEGYVEEIVVRSPAIIIVEYHNSNGSLLAYQQQILSSGGALSIDSEGYSSEPVLISGHEGQIFLPSYDNEAINLVWCDDRFSYFLSGYFDREEMIKIAESILFVD